MEKYTLRDLFQDFDTTDKCIRFIAELRWPDGIYCQRCRAVTRHHLISSRRAYACQHCKKTTSPTADTAFGSSKVPLPDWFYVLFQMVKTRTGIAAKQVERELGVSYPTALRMCHTIREAMAEHHEAFDTTVEVDETYMGTKRKWHNKRGRGTSKQAVFGIQERGGRIVAKVVDDTKRDTLLPMIQEAVEEGTEVFTDEYSAYATLTKEGYAHDTVKHGERQYVKYRVDGEKVHTNELEGFWSYPKNAIKGVHRGVSDKHLQKYIDEYTFRQSHRHDEEPMFFTVLHRMVHPETPPSAQAA